MPQHDIAFYQVEGGQNSTSDPSRLNEQQAARLVNCRILNGMPTTRFGARLLPAFGEAAEVFATENVQGAMFYNPAEGQGAVSFGIDESVILASCGGRKLVLSLEGRDMQSKCVVTEETNGVRGDANLHLAFWSQWENYALCGDGNGNCWIWDGANPAFASPGYNNVDKERSQVPNGGTVMAYAHGRGAIAVNSRAVLVGDQLNRISQTSAEDVLFFREQVYWATGQYFSPPTKMGEITAAAILPIQDLEHGHGELMIHCRKGIFSVDLNVFPRAKWSETKMTKTAYLGSGAAGPYAVAMMDGDQIFRSHSGVKTLRSARAENRRTGNPRKPVSEMVRSFFAADSPRYLRFASVATWEQERRGFITCYPIVQGRFRWHRGAVVANFDPVPSDATPAAWEGLWTLPPQAQGIVQFVNGTWDTEERFFAICRGDDKRNRLVEFRSELRDDVLQDGTHQRIRCQLISRQIDTQKPFVKKNFTAGTLFLRNIEGVLDWAVWFRPRGDRRWTLWRSGKVENCSTCDSELGCEPPALDLDIPLGSLPDACGRNTSRHIQFLVRWAGYCSVESIRVTYGGESEDEFQPAKLDFKVEPCDRALAEFDDYEYSDRTEADSWLQQLA